jgi:hypothetical protein
MVGARACWCASATLNADVMVVGTRPAKRKVGASILWEGTPSTR